MERADFVGTEYEFRPLNSSYINNNPISIDLGFNFLEDAVRADTKKWHYPCVANMECRGTEMSTILVGTRLSNRP